jgi:hypothetical protein
VLSRSPHDLDMSIQAVASLVPGGLGIASSWGRRAVGAAVHMSLSAGFATLYACRIRRGAVFYGAALWLINVKVLAPPAFRRMDRSRALADHLVWALITDLTLKAMS